MNRPHRPFRRLTYVARSQLSASPSPHQLGDEPTTGRLSKQPSAVVLVVA